MIKKFVPSKAYANANNGNIILMQGRDGRYIPFVNAENITNGMGIRLDAQFPLAQDIMDLKVQLQEAFARGEI